MAAQAGPGRLCVRVFDKTVGWRGRTRQRRKGAPRHQYHLSLAERQLGMKDLGLLPRTSPFHRDDIHDADRPQQVKVDAVLGRNINRDDR